ncbi:MAG: tyrosine-type recombinase/integrase [Rhodomicrobiaceae bacterium]
MKLTDFSCKNFKPKNKPYKQSDGRGLFLLINPNGSKLWRYKYRIEGKERLFAIGSYPEFSLAEARALHQNLHKLVAGGIDPYEHKKMQKRKEEMEKALTFQVVGEEWLEKRKSQVKEKTYKDIEKRLYSDVFPKIGHIPMKELMPQDILKMLQNIEKREAYEMANRARQYCSRILRYASACGIDTRDYTLDIADALVTRPVRHQNALSPDEIKEFLTALDRNNARLHLQSRLGLEMLMLTFVRPIELAEARWDEFNLQESRWTIPASRMKMKCDHIVPLAKQTHAIIGQLRELNGTREHLFTNHRDQRRPMCRDTFSKGVRLLGFQGRHSAHGFRALARTSIREKLDYDPEVIERQLAHKASGPLGSAYDRTQFLDQRSVMMQDWADYIEQIRN